MKTKRLFLIGNAHIDPVWLWQWQEGFHEVRATFRSALDRMQEYPEFIFTASSAAFYEWVEQSDPGLFSEIQQRVAESRWKIAGGWWIEPDCNIPCGESFVRQGLYGQRYFREKFGEIAKFGYAIDSFGHNGMLPQILKKSGMNYYVFMRPAPHEKGLPGHLFWWESDDGSRVLAFRIVQEYATWGDTLPQQVKNVAAELDDTQNELMCFYGVGNHGGGPTRENLDNLRRLRGDSRLPDLVNGSPDRFFAAVGRPDAVFPVVHDDLQHHASGCYSAHSGVKKWNRKAENMLLAAEKFSALAAQFTGQPYPGEFQRAWKNVLFNQFHDIMAGTSLEAAYDDARDQFGEAISIASRAMNSAIQAMAWKINVEPDSGLTPIAVFNPHAWTVRTNVELEIHRRTHSSVLLGVDNQPVPFQMVKSHSAAGKWRVSFLADLPPMGYKLYRFVDRQNGETLPSVSASQTMLENDSFRLDFDTETGYILSLYDKARHLEVFAGEAAVPVVIDDPSDTWSHGVRKFDHVIGKFRARKVALIEQGPVKSVIRVTSKWGSSTLLQDFALFAEKDEIEVSVTIDWREKQKMLKLRFPLNLSHQTATAEIPYGHIERAATGEEEPCQSWIDVTGIAPPDEGRRYGLSILNDSKYSYDVKGCDVGITLLRSPIYAHHIPFEPDPEKDYSYIDQGIQKFHYALLPHEGSWTEAGTVRKAAELNQPPIVLVTTVHAGPLPHTGSFLSVDCANLVVSVLKKAEENDDLVIRCYETAGMPATGKIRIALPGFDRQIEAAYGPCEIKTFLIPRDLTLPVIETNLLEFLPEEENHVEI